LEGAHSFSVLKSSCVTIPERCDVELQKGVYPSKIRGKGPFEDLKNVQCDIDEEHIACEQIFPRIKHEYWYTPTVKHHCPRTALASSLRACSNKVGFDPEEFSKYKAWFENSFIPKFVRKCLDKEDKLINVELNDWLKKFPINYRLKLLKSMHPDNRPDRGNMDSRYEAFTKVEMQFTSVQHFLKETELNDTKERQICGPTDYKKLVANAFVNKLEELASKHYHNYCGRANWIEICEGLDKIECKLNNPIWGASDGSGFDMTQYPEMNLLMNKLFKTCLYHDKMNLVEPFSRSDICEALDKSIYLKVGIDHGLLKYDAVGRASGDGWTTCGNTLLMLSYWTYCLEEVAGLSSKQYGLKVKGDDVLFCIEAKNLELVEDAITRVFTKYKHEHNHGLGQICKKVNYGDITDLDFLSNEFFRTSEGKIRMTRIPARVLQTNCWTTKMPKYPMTAEKKLEIREQLCFSKGKCLKAWADGLPIFSVLADKMIELGRKGKWNQTDQYADEPRVWHAARDDRQCYMDYLSKNYCVTEQEVVEAEKVIKGITNLSGFIELPSLEKFYMKEELAC